MHHTSKRDMTIEFFDHAKTMMKKSKMNEDLEISPDNVYQEAHTENRADFLEMVRKTHLPGSTIIGVENILKLNKLALEGKSCLILSEHISNCDVPSLFARFYDYEKTDLKEIFDRIIFVAGVKLNQTPLVKLFTEMFTRVVIYPIRGMHKLNQDQSKHDEFELAKKINMRSSRKILELKHKKSIFLMYPTGTRYREWDPDSKKGMKETMAYLNQFDYVCCCAVNGNNMPPKEHEDMTREPILKDIVMFTFGEVFESKDFTEKVIADNPQLDADDKDGLKQLQVDKIMSMIDELHQGTEKIRKPLIEKMDIFKE